MNYFDKVYSLVQKIPKGKVTTYGNIARALGNPRMSRQVGWALHANPSNSVTPCHRVVNQKGELSSAFAFGGKNMQQELLEREGVEVCHGSVDLNLYFYDLTK